MSQVFLEVIGVFRSIKDFRLIVVEQLRVENVLRSRELLTACVNNNVPATLN